MYVHVFKFEATPRDFFVCSLKRLTRTLSFQKDISICFLFIFGLIDVLIIVLFVV